MNNDRNQRLLSLCQQDLADYAANRKAEVDKGRETPELAGLLVQKYGYGMNQVLAHLAEVENTGRIGSVDVDAAAAIINPEWAEFDKKRWAAKQVGISMGKAEPVKVVHPKGPLIVALGLTVLFAVFIWWQVPYKMEKRAKTAVAKAENTIKQFDAKFGDANQLTDFQGIPFKAFSSSKLNAALSKDLGKYPVANGEYRNPFINLPGGAGAFLLRLENIGRKYDFYQSQVFMPKLYNQLYNGVAMVRVKDDAISVYFNSATVSEDTATFQDTLAFSRVMLEELAKKSKVSQKNAGSWK